MLDIYALIRTNPCRKVEHLGLTENFGGEKTPRLFPHDWRVQAFFDGGPNRKRWCKVKTINRQVRAITHTNFVNGVKQMIGCVSREHVREPRFHTHADERQQATVAPLGVSCQLGGTQRLANFVVRVGGVWFGQIHGHVHIGAARFKGCFENGVVQARVTRVDDDVDLVGPRQRDKIVFVVGIHLGRQKAVRVVQIFQGIDATLFVDIGQYEDFKKCAGLGD